LFVFSASVHLPRIGFNTPGFNWYGTERLIRKYLVAKGIPTYMYPFEINSHMKYESFPHIYCTSLAHLNNALHECHPGAPPVVNKYVILISLYMYNGIWYTVVHQHFMHSCPMVLSRIYNLLYILGLIYVMFGVGSHKVYLGQTGLNILMENALQAKYFTNQVAFG
jgi:hypothetical protein